MSDYGLTVHSIWREIGKGRERWVALGYDDGLPLIMSKVRLKKLCSLLRRRKDPPSLWTVDLRSRTLTVTWPRQGCCGSAERYVIIGDRQYIIGCNYGH